MNRLRGEFAIDLPDGTSVPVLCNNHALGIFCEEESINVTDIDKAFNDAPLAVVPRLLWAGVRCHHTLHDLELPMSFDKFAILFGSVDWDDAVAKLTTAMSLDTGPRKKKTPRK